MKIFIYKSLIVSILLYAVLFLIFSKTIRIKIVSPKEPFDVRITGNIETSGTINSVIIR